MIIKGDLYKIKDFLFFKQLDKNDLNHLFCPVMIWDGKKLDVKMSFIEKKSREDFDYDYDENLVSNGIIEEYIYHVIPYNPYDGTKFEFSVKNIENKTEQYNKIIRQELEWTQKRGSKQKSEAIYSLSKEKEELMNIGPIFYKNKDDIYGEFDFANWIDIVENIKLF